MAKNTGSYKATSKSRKDGLTTPVQIVDGKGVAVAARFENATDARNAYLQARGGATGPYARRAARRAHLQLLYEGHPPIAPSILEARNLNWVSNFDLGEFRTGINQFTAALWRVLFNVPSIVQLNATWPNVTPIEREYARKIAIRFTGMLRRSMHFAVHARAAFRDMAMFGSGLLMPEDKNTWLPSYSPLGSFLFDPDASVILAQNDTHFILGDMPVATLLGKVANKSVAEKLGWDVESVRKAIVEHLRANNSQMTTDLSMDQLVKMCGSGNATTAVGASKFNYVNILTRCADGSYVDRYVIPLRQPADEKSAKAETFIKVEPEAYRSMDDAMTLLCFDCGDTTLKSINGLGRELFSTCHAQNRIVSTVLTGLEMASGITTTGVSQNLDRSPIEKVGPFMNIPEEFKLVQSSMLPNARMAMDARGLIDSIQNRNVSPYRTMRSTTGTARTAAEANIHNQREQGMEADQDEWFFIQWCALVGRMYARAMADTYPSSTLGYEERQTMLRQLRNDGVPEEYLKEGMWIPSAVHAIGNGSLSQQLQVTNEMQVAKRDLSERGRRNVDIQWWGMRGGWDNIGDFIEETPDQSSTFHDSQADSENVDMANGNERIVTADDNDAIHMGQHARPVQGMLQAIAQKQVPDPARMMGIMAIYAKHMMLHLAKMEASPSRKAEVAGLSKLMKAMTRAMAQLRPLAEKQMAERQQQQMQQQKLMEKGRTADIDGTIELGKYKIDREVELARERQIQMHEIEKLKATSQNTAREAKLMVSMKAKLTELEAALTALRETTAAQIEAIRGKAAARS